MSEAFLARVLILVRNGCRLPPVAADWHPSCCHTAEMGFRLVTGNASFEDFGDDDKYRIADNGILQIDKPDGARRYYSPTGWAFIEEKRDPNSPSTMFM